ncbi:hypothetical protein TYRP_013565 [Tyrophagus putrescentiae]|nr:hypothetical protein TYRP_013565 [Tyrophagus putrescentiae]
MIIGYTKSDIHYWVDIKSGVSGGNGEMDSNLCVSMRAAQGPASLKTKSTEWTLAPRRGAQVFHCVPTGGLFYFRFGGKCIESQFSPVLPKHQFGPELAITVDGN